MSEDRAEAPLWMPDLGDMPSGPARILVWLVVWRDGRGSCDPTHADLCKVTKLDESTVRRHTGWLAREGWAKRERRRRPDGSLGGWRYWLNLRRLGLAGSEGAKSAGRFSAASEILNSETGEGANCALPRAASGAVENHPEARAQNVQVACGRQAKSEGAKCAGRQNSEGAKPVGLYRDRGPARARLSLYSFPLSFAFRDDAQREAMERILAVCGVGLCDPVQCDGLSESLAQVLDEWLTRFDLDADIIPCIEKGTRNPRPKPVYDFRLFDRPGDSDLQRWREARLLREQRKAERAAKPKASNGANAAKSARQPDELDRWLGRSRRQGEV